VGVTRKASKENRAKKSQAKKFFQERAVMNSIRQQLSARTRALSVSLLFAAAVTSAPAQTAKSFEVTGSGSAAGQGTEVLGINSAGTLVGTFLDSGSVYHAFTRTKAGVVTVYTDPNGGTSVKQGTGFNGINAAGVISGAYNDSGSVVHGIVVATDGTVTEFDAADAGTSDGQGTFPRGINKAGTIAGNYWDSSGVSHGFVRNAKTGKITAFSASGAGTSKGQGTYLILPAGSGPIFSNGPVINTAGDIVGFYLDALGALHGFERAANGTITEFNAPGAGSAIEEGTAFAGINTTGTIVGSYRDSSKVWHGFTLATDGTYTDINAGTSTSVDTFAFGINDAGVVTGTYVDASLNLEGFVLAADGTLSDFEAPKAGTKGNGQGTWPLVMNDAGDIAGFVLNDEQEFEGFIRTP
jgi:hypothetical protein